MKKLRYLLLSLCMIWGCTNPPPPQAPNIVFLFADDMTYTAIQALGNSEIKTPNLDRLVKDGTTFTHAYNMGGWNGAICMASRAMINSGRFIWRARALSKHWSEGDSIQSSWAKLMEKQGYDTYMSGKWHVPLKADENFSQANHIRPGMPRDSWPDAKVGRWFSEKGLKSGVGEVDPYDVMPIGYARPRNASDTAWRPADTSFGGFWEGGKHWSEVLKDDALSYIQTASAKENPFFMYLAFNAPHDPRQAPQSYIDGYPLDQISLPESFQPDYPYRDSIGNGWGLRDEALAPIPRTEYATKVHIQEYYAIITHMDEQIGLILDALEASGEMDNTYLIFSADHGLAVGNHGLLGKQSMYDHSMRVPLMIAGPGIPKGQSLQADVYLQDIMATSLELAGCTKPDFVDFNSLLPLIKGEQKNGNYEAHGIYGCYRDLQRMVRKDGYKLIVYPKIKKLRLYDLNNDPHEMHDLAEESEHADTLKELFGHLVELQKEMGDELDLMPIFSEQLSFKLLLKASKKSPDY